MPKQLETLNVSHNKLKSVGESISRLMSLKALDMSFNQISDCKGLEILTKLQVLNLSHNEITSLEHFDSLCMLKEIDLRFNKIATWNPPNALSALDSLEIVLLEANEILS
eukprot:TRINITY_DN15684_c0_g3_i2.p4 TRINITY_DN15684_c0_g3~~TRINITY_DN15684_c0_g3_i2.p4  ORF type:complete len:110 (-),score=22.70 TRINITY_DN15684_c0_g3_i2:484-813(-)